MAKLEGITRGLLLATLAVAAGACNGGSTDTEETGDTADTDTDTTGPVYLEPVFLAVSGQFGYDATNDEVIDYSIPDSAGEQGTASAATIKPIVVVDMYEEPDGNQITEEEYVCSIVVEQAGPIARVDTLGSSSWTPAIAFEFDLSTATVDATSCDGLLDPALWGDDVSTSIASSPVVWGMGVDTSVEQSIAEYLESQIDDADAWAASWEGKLLGARPYLSTIGTMTSGEGDEFYWARAVAIDGDGQMVWDDANDDGVYDYDDETATYLDAGDVPATGGYTVSLANSIGGYTNLHEVLLGTSQ